MRILHLSTSDTQGGAARAAFRLHTGLRRMGHDSQMLVLKKSSGDDSVKFLKPRDDFFSKWKRKRRHKLIAQEHASYKRPAGYELFSDDRTDQGANLVSQLPQCDLVNLHWVAGLVDHESFFNGVPQQLPIVWRLADMAPLTGGCHYDSNCGKYTQVCGACPQLASGNPLDLSYQIWNRKKTSLAKVLGRMHLVGTSRWIAAEAQKSSILREFPVSVIPNGLDTEVFAPRDKKFARESLGIPQDARVALFVADSTEIVRKGYSHLVDALKGITGVDKVALMSIGSGKAEIDAPLLQFHMGRVTNDRLLSIIYSAADVFVIPSLQESFGQTVIEAMACGTPVVGFAAGGIPDMVRPGITGELAPVGDTAALRDALKKLLTDDLLRSAMSTHCRRIALEEYSLETQAKAYSSLYETLLADRRRAA